MILMSFPYCPIQSFTQLFDIQSVQSRISPSLRLFFYNFFMVSIRCKVLRKARAIKRSTNFGQAEKERLSRLVSKLENLEKHIPEGPPPEIAKDVEMANLPEQTKKEALMNRNQLKKKKKAKLGKKRK